MLGATRPELGGSEWAAVLHGETGGMPPVADLATARRLHEFVAEIVVDREVTGVHDVSDGGLAVALAEMAFAGEVGFKVDLTTDGCTAAEACFVGVDVARPCSPSRATASPRSSGARSPRVYRPRWSATRGGDRLIAKGAFDVALGDAAAAWRNALPALLSPAG